MLEYIGNKIMPTRYEGLEDAISGMNKSNIYGVGEKNGDFFNAGWSDDQGLYVFSQFLNKYFDLTAMESIGLFYVLIISLGFVLYILGSMLLFSNKKTIFVSFIGILILTLLTYKVRDTYIMFYFTGSFVFIFIWMFKKQKDIKPALLLSMLFIIGLSLEMSNLFRGHAGTGVLLFICLYIFLSRFCIKNKVLFISVFLTSSLAINFLWSNTIQIPKERFLKQVGTDLPITSSHPFWHSVYIGLGFVDNHIVSTYKDEIGIEKVKSINSDVKYLSMEYENILRGEVILYVIKYPLLFLQNISAKIGVLVFYFILFVNLGIYYIVKNIKNIEYRETLPFYVGILFNSLFGILVIPSLNYIIGFISFSILFAIYIMNYAFEKNKTMKGNL
ncbi:hypothetical protein [Aliarcobacter cryaerophilus]|uniref:hypothetical protein n=1 Tax=Aliarcobacter cryaerophilus TaxID=28198 RepID=UPI0008301B01|nr:hypothetical protein [Aliarcobacter cryaerophilus]